ncbi:MAG: hypothetical protein U5N85_05755 [Arcicella sp.]|nr:hypothetical protein [Arcicella sp.]
MKRLISIIFLSLIVMKIGGYFSFLKVQQLIFKEEAKEKIICHLPKEKLVKFSFSKQEFVNLDWEEDGREFYFNHNLYDIVRSEFDGKIHTLYCFSDHKETAVYDKIVELSDAHNDELPQKNNMASFLNLLLLKYTIPPIFYLDNKATFVCISPIKYANLKLSYSSIPTSLFIPPPNQ